MRTSCSPRVTSFLKTRHYRRLFPKGNLQPRSTTWRASKGTMEHTNQSAPQGLKPEAWAANYLGMTRGTLRKWRLLKRGPSWVVVNNRAIRYSVADLDAYLIRCRQNSGGAN